jgi:hypothetical protein
VKHKVKEGIKARTVDAGLLSLFLLSYVLKISAAVSE